MDQVPPEAAKPCPRCSSPVQVVEHMGEVCTRCTWPNPSYVQMAMTLAKKDLTATGYSMTDQGLEDFAASLKSETTLKDPKGQFVQAKVFEVHVHDGQVDVTFEFDPRGWQLPQ